MSTAAAAPAEAAAQTREDQIETWAREQAAKAPPLTEEQVRRVSAVLAAGRDRPRGLVELRRAGADYHP